MVHIDYDTVKKTHGDNALVIYGKIAKIAGGDPSPAHEGGMDLSGLPDAKIKQIEKLMEKPSEESVETKKDGKK